MTAALFAAPADGQDLGVEVLGLDAAATLSFATGRRRTADLAAARELEAVAHWADLHRLGRGGLGAVDPQILDTIPIREQVEIDADRRGYEGMLRMAGQGAFMIEEYAVSELATALGMSEHAGRGYVGQAVELRDRLPHCWEQVMIGRLPAWKACQIAQRTIPLADDTAAAIDADVAPFAHRLTFTRITRLVDAAIQRHQPELAAQRDVEAAERRGVWLDDQLDGTTDVHAHLDTPDATALDHALEAVATTLGRLGDSDPREVRRARALGVLADPQYALDLATTADAAEAGTSTRPRPPRAVPTLHVHLHLDAVEAFGIDRECHDAERETAPLVRVDRAGHRLGARTLETLERWIGGLTPGSRLHVTPVVDLTTEIAVDQYEIPAPLRRQIEERDATCTFPWCGNAGRHDLDHRTAYIPMDEGGPPGQTSTSNLHRLCRFHHRLKTNGAWQVERHPDGIVWTSPHGRRYRVAPDGTTSLPSLT